MIQELNEVHNITGKGVLGAIHAQWYCEVVGSYNRPTTQTLEVSRVFPDNQETTVEKYDTIQFDHKNLGLRRIAKVTKTQHLYKFC